MGKTSTWAEAALGFFMLSSLYALTITVCWALFELGVV